MIGRRRALGAAACLLAGCADGVVTQERAQVDEALARSVVAVRLSEIQASAELERERLTQIGDPSEEAAPQRGRLSMLRARVAELHRRLEVGTVVRVEKSLAAELAGVRRRRAVLEDRIRGLDTVLAKWDAPAPGEAARLTARHWVLAARVALRRAADAIRKAKACEEADAQTPRLIRRTADRLRSIARVIRPAYGADAARLGFEVKEIDEFIKKLEAPIRAAKLAGEQFQDTPFSSETAASVRVRCREAVALIEGWQPRISVLPALQTRRLVVEAAATDGWLRRQPIEPDRITELLNELRTLLAERGEAVRAETLAPRIAAIPRDDRLSAWAVELAEVLLVLVPEDEGRR